MRERETEQEIVDALTLAGFAVIRTTARKAKGGLGSDQRIPDLLVWHPVAAETCPGLLLGMEIKRPGCVRWSSPAQKQAHGAGMTALAQSAPEALEQAEAYLKTASMAFVAEPPAAGVDAALARAKRVREAWTR